MFMYGMAQYAYRSQKPNLCVGAHPPPYLRQDLLLYTMYTRQDFPQALEDSCIYTSILPEEYRDYRHKLLHPALQEFCRSKHKSRDYMASTLSTERSLHPKTSKIFGNIMLTLY